VLRKNSSLIYTILEVFFYDPLFSWEADHKKNKKNIIIKVDRNKTAENTLRVLSEKLSGTEENENLSVEGQVNKLINLAQSPDLLSRMFYGWAPWV
jgi:phosphatidylinositol kinase/protein kinase (PI-3  family)